jgi:oligopeptide transport system substrate-binding protein
MNRIKCGFCFCNIRNINLLCAVWLLACSTWACAQVLHRGNGPEPDSLDPQRGQSLSAQNILRDLFEGLTRESADGAIEPGLAERWETSKDGLTWRFYLRPNVRFSDGSVITADHVVQSFRRALDPQTAAPYAGILSVIVGAAAIQRAQASESEFGVRAIDAQSLEIRLAQITPNLPARLSLPIASILPIAHIKALEAQGKQWTRTEHMISSGAYQLKNWRPLSAVQLSANAHYYQQDMIAIREVHFHVTEDTSEEARRFEAGELHITETVPPGRKAQLEARFGNKLRIAPSLGSFYLGLNLTRPPLKDNLALRQSLSLAIDRERIVNVITGTGELPAFGLLPPPLRGDVLPDSSPREVLPYRRTGRQEREQAARALYQTAGYSAEKPLTLELRYNTSVLNRRMMLAISVMWEQVLGVRTILRQEEMKVLVQNRKAKRITQAFRGGWNADLPDALDFLELFDSQSPLNTSGFHSPAYMELLNALRVEADPQKARALSLRAEAELMRAQPIIPLFHYTSKHLVDSKLANYIDNPLDHHPTRVLAWIGQDK